MERVYWTARILAWACFLGWAGSFAFLSRMPGEAYVSPQMLEDPVQKPIPLAKIPLTYDGAPYEIIRNQSYDIRGIVLAQSGPPGGIGAMFRPSVPNVRDICLVWGHTVKSGGYRAISARNTPDLCWVDYGTKTAAISKTDVGNNHLLALDAAVRATLERVEIGDQLHLTGSLADYDAAPWNEGKRHSSQLRNDFGANSGEVMFVDTAEILRSENRTLRLLHNALFFLFPLLFALEVYLAADYGPIKRVK